jgi:hypothetical protein
MIAIAIALALAATYAYLLGSRYLASKTIQQVDPVLFDQAQKDIAELTKRVQSLEAIRAIKRGA